jgi:hypothetical protein
MKFSACLSSRAVWSSSSYPMITGTGIFPVTVTPAAVSPDAASSQSTRKRRLPATMHIFPTASEGLT